MAVTTSINSWLKQLAISRARLYNSVRQQARLRYRWLILVGIMVKFCLITPPVLLEAAWYSVLIYASFCALYELPLTARWAEKRQHAYRLMRIVVDLGCFTAFLFAAAERSSEIYLLFIIPIIGASKYFKLLGTLAAVGYFAVIHFWFFIATSPAPETLTDLLKSSLLSFLVRAFFILIIGVYSSREGLLSRREEKIIKVLDVINENFYMGSILDHLTTNLNKIIDKKNKNIFIHLVDRKKRVLKIVKVGGDYCDDALQNLETSIDLGITGWVMRTRKPYLCNNIEDLPLVDTTTKNAPTETPSYIRFCPQTRAELAVPIMWRETVIGVLNLESSSYGAFTYEDVELLELFARQAAVAILSSTIFNTQHLIHQSLDLDRTLDIIFQQTNQLIDFENGIIFLFHADSQTLVERKAYGADYEASDREKFTFIAGEEISGLLITHQTALNVPDVPDSPYRSKYPAISKNKPLRSYLGVRLSFGDRIVGAFILVSEQPNKFNDGNLSLLSLIGSQAAVAIANAEDYRLSLTKRLQARTHELKAVQDLISEMNKEIDLTSTLEVILNGCLKFTKGHSGFILIVNKDRALIATVHRYLTLKDRLLTFENFAKECEALRTGQRLHTGDISADSHRALYQRYFPDEIHSVLAIPLHMPNDLSGVISLHSPSMNQFTPEHVHILEVFAHQASLAISKALTFSELSKYNKILPCLVGDINFHAVVTAVKDSFQARGCSLFLLEGEELICIATTRENFNLNEEQVTYHLNESEHLTSYIGRTGKPVRLYNASDSKERAKIHPDLEKRKEPKFIEVSPEGSRPFLGVALKAGAEIIGVIRLVWHKELAFTVNDERILTTVANQLADKIKTDKLRKEDQLRYLHSEKMAALGGLSGGIAHQINNPLATIKLYVINALGKNQDPVVDEYLNIAAKHLERAGRVVDSLLHFLTPSAGTYYLINIDDALTSALELVNNDIDATMIDLELKLTPHLPKVYANVESLSQVFFNIIHNAYQSMKQPGKITITTRNEEQPPAVVIEVKDTGCGIPEADLGKIFDPFFTRRGVGKGTGLGLTVCHTIISELGGTIKVDSKPGVGSVFKITIPFKEEEHGFRS